MDGMYGSSTEMKFEIELTDETADAMFVAILRDQLDTVRTSNCTLKEDIEYNEEIEQHLIAVLKHNLPHDEWDTI